MYVCYNHSGYIISLHTVVIVIDLCTFDIDISCLHFDDLLSTNVMC